VFAAFPITPNMPDPDSVKSAALAAAVSAAGIVLAIMTDGLPSDLRTEIRAAMAEDLIDTAETWEARLKVNPDALREVEAAAGIVP
jgi:hypothetical protein